MSIITKQLQKKCLKCNKTFSKKYNYSMKYWLTQRFCSISCSKLGLKASSETKLKMSEGHKRYLKNNPNDSIERSERVKALYATGKNTGTLGKHWKKTEAQLENKRGEKNPAWKGDHVGYTGLHYWVKRCLGKPSYCKNCGKYGTKQQMHWANISGRYKRLLSDWIRLCAMCHKQYDMGRLSITHLIT